MVLRAGDRVVVKVVANVRDGTARALALAGCFERNATRRGDDDWCRIAISRQSVRGKNNAKNVTEGKWSRAAVNALL